MNAKILRIVDKGDIENERIVIKVLIADNIGRYAIFRSGTNSNGKGITNKVYNTYWFPDGDVGTGDLIVLYTKSGISSDIRNNDGTTTHFYYWGLGSSIWDSSSHVVTLVSTPEWNVLLL